MTDLATYATVVEEQYPVLGRLLWYSVSEPKIAYDDLEKKMHTLGISVAYLPPKTRGVDAFRNAAKSSWIRRVKDGEISENYMLREVVCDDKHVVQHVMRETVNARNVRLSYDHVGTATFIRPDPSHPHGRVLVENLAPFFEERLKGIVDGIAANLHSEFVDRVQFLHANAIRGVLRRALEAMHSVTVRPSGGVFFVPEEHKDAVDKLSQLMNDFGGECHMHSLPLIDAQDQREMLNSAFENETVIEIERMMGDLGELLKTGKRVTINRANEFVSQYRRLTSKMKNYSELLDDQLDRSTTSLSLFKTQIDKLLELAE